jgi:hypothetical protein
VDPANSLVLYLGGSTSSTTHPKGLYKTVDGGATWTAL